MDESLLQAIREQPDDDDPRLVLADWLSDRGDPRGEFMVLQVRLARMQYDDDERRWMEKRRRELLAEHGAEWRRGLDDIPTLSLGHLERGFVRRVAIADDVLAERAASLFAAAPMLEEVFVRAGEFGGVAQVPPQLARLRAIGICGSRFAVAALASPYLAGLEKLDIEDQCSGPEMATRVATAQLRRLTSLSFFGTRITNTGLATLTAWPGLARLRKLELRHNELEPTKQFAAFAMSPHVGELRRLVLNRNPLREAGARAVLTSPQLAALEFLDLSDTNAHGAIADTALPNLKVLRYEWNVVGIAEATAFANSDCPIERLDIGGRNDEGQPCLAVDGAIAIVSSPKLAKLTAIDLQQNRFRKRATDIFEAFRPGFRELNVSWMKFDERGARALATNPNLASLVSLDLTENELTPAIVEALAASPYLRPRILKLGYTKLGNDGVAALAASPVLSEIRTLELTGCELDDRAVRELAASPHLDKLCRLSLYNNKITDDGAIALGVRASIQPLIELALGANPAGSQAVEALEAAGHRVRI